VDAYLQLGCLELISASPGSLEKKRPARLLRFNIKLFVLEKPNKMAVRPHQNDVQSRNHRHFVCLSLYNSASLPICRSICRSIQFQQATEILAKLKIWEK